MRLRQAAQAFTLAVISCSAQPQEASRKYCEVDENFEHGEQLNRICVDTRESIGYPAFTVVDQHSVNPKVETDSLYTCLSVVIYDPLKKKGLLAHFLTGEEGGFSPCLSQCPRESYIQYFKERYYPQDSNDLVLLLIKGERTPGEDFEAMKGYLLEQFPNAKSFTDEQEAPCSRRRISLDVLTGEVVIEDISAHLEKGTAEECIPTMAKWSSHSDIFTTEDRSTIMPRLEEALKEVKNNPVQVRTWNLKQK